MIVRVKNSGGPVARLEYILSNNIKFVSVCDHLDQGTK